MAATVGKRVWTGRVLSWLVAIGFLLSAFMKLKGGEELLKDVAPLGLPERMLFPLGILELTCALIYLIPVTSVLGAILLTGYIGGAICTHWRVGDPFLVQIALGVVVWLGLWLRDARLWALLPLRRTS